MSRSKQFIPVRQPGDPDIFVRRPPNPDQPFVRLGDAAKAVVDSVPSKKDFSALTPADIDVIASEIEFLVENGVPYDSAWVWDDAERLAAVVRLGDLKHYGTPVCAGRRRQPSLVPAMAQPMQQQRAIPSSPLVQEQAMAQSDQQKPPGKGEFGGLCGHETCSCVGATFEYVHPEADKRAYGKFFCAGCAHDKQRQLPSYSWERSNSLDPPRACIERTAAPAEEKKPEPKSKPDDHYWNLG
jgi:hypothetical protein